jgi:serine/threonine protein kinase
LDRFKIVRHLDAGGMGDVYEASDLELGRIALKTIRADIVSSPEILSRFRREVQLARKVSGPHVCPCLHLCFSAYINSLANELALMLFNGKTHELHGFKQVISHGFLSRGGVTFLDGLVNRPMVPQNRRRNARQQEFELNAMAHKVSQHLQ